LYLGERSPNTATQETELYEFIVTDIRECYDGASAGDENVYQVIDQGEQKFADEELQFQK
jgi:hypothetical protein